MKYILSLFIITSILACKKYEPEIGPAPSEQDSEFTVTPSSGSDNVLNLSSSNQSILCKWDLGNGSTASGNNITANYPYAGTYTIELTVFGKGGSTSRTKEIVIANDDLSLLNNPIYGMLTGGVSGSGSKTWYIDSNAVGHMGVGPDPESALGPTPEYWAAPENGKPGVGLYDDRYVFSLSGFGFDMVTNGDVYIHNSFSGSFPGSYENLSDYTAPFADQLGGSWLLTEGAESSITTSGNSFIGFWTGVQTYRIVDITDSTMSLQYKQSNEELLWYLKLKSI